MIPHGNGIMVNINGSYAVGKWNNGNIIYLKKYSGTQKKIK